MRRLSLSFALALGLPITSSVAMAQTAAPASSNASSTGDVTNGVFRREVEGTVPVRFVFRGHGAEPIGVSAETDDVVLAEFSPVCSTPCTLWFARGPHFVELGRSPLRTRVFQLELDDRPAEVSFSRDFVPGVIAGFLAGGAGLITSIIAGGLAIYDQTLTSGDRGLAYGLAGAGLVSLIGGAVLAFFSFGSTSIHYDDLPRQAP